MKAVRLHSYHERPSVDEVPEPAIKGPLDVLVRIGAAGHGDLAPTYHVRIVPLLPGW